MIFYCVLNEYIQWIIFHRSLITILFIRWSCVLFLSLSHQKKKFLIIYNMSTKVSIITLSFREKKKIGSLHLIIQSWFQSDFTCLLGTSKSEKSVGKIQMNTGRLWVGLQKQYSWHQFFIFNFVFEKEIWIFFWIWKRTRGHKILKQKERSMPFGHTTK